MNEQIRQLAEQAKASVPAGLVVEEWIQVYNKNFAELIVKECISVCENQAGIQSMAYRCNLVEHDTSPTADACANMIKQHFGVEE